MIDLGPHAVFIAASYIGVAIVLAGLVFYVIGDSNRQKKRLAALEAATNRDAKS